MGSGRHLALALFLALGAPLAGVAQSVMPSELGDAARIGEQLLREQQQLEEERRRVRERERQRPSGGELSVEPETSASAPAAGECIEVSALELVGARLLPVEQRQQLERTVAGQCIGAPALDALLKRVTNAYVSLGYVTTRAYVPPQTATDGRLTIVIIEGTIERVELVPPDSASVDTAFPHLVGEVFNLRSAEQGLDQLNRLPSNNARLDIRPGGKPGSSVLAILNEPRSRVSGSLSADNTGSAQTGEWQGTFTATADNFLGLNDGFLASHTRSVDDPEGTPDSRATYVSYSVPYGWWLGSFTYSESHYDTVVEGVTRDFVMSGESESAGVRFDYVAYRDQSRKLTLYSGLSRRDSKNFVAGQLIGSSSRTLTVVDLEANLSIAGAGALWSFDAGLAQGLRSLGALDDDSELPGSAPRAQFTKLMLGASVSRNIGWLGLNAQFKSAVRGQWSNDVLYSSEQLSLAGPFSVRGYRDVRVYGDRGLTWRNELTFPFTLAADSGAPVAVRPFVGVDYGRLWSHNGVPGAYLSGAALGTSILRGPVALQLSWSAAGPRSTRLGDDHLFFARFSTSF